MLMRDLCRYGRHFVDIKGSPSVSASKRWLDDALKDSEGIISREDAHFLLRECTKLQDLETCRKVQSLVVLNGLDSVPILANHLIRLFSACRDVSEANQAFLKVSMPGEYSWGAIIESQVKLGQPEMAIQFYEIMLQSGVKTNKHIFVSTLKACIQSSNFNQGQWLHEQVIQNGWESDVYIGSVLIDVYTKCGNLLEAGKVFDKLTDHNVVSWTTMIAGFVKCGNMKEARRLFDESPYKDVVLWGVMIEGYTEHGQGHLAIECYKNMQHLGIKPDNVIFLSALKACSSVGAIEQGRYVHKDLMESETHLDICVWNTLIDMYAKCGRMDEAHDIFDKIPKPDVVSWNAMIAGYAKCGNLHEARKLFDMLEDRSLLSWGAMVVGYAQHGEGFLALECFDNMLDGSIVPDTIIYSSVLKACGSIRVIEQGRRIHADIIGREIQSDVYVGTTLIDMYFKCGSLEEAHYVFDQLPNQNVATWGVLIAGYAEYGEGILALDYFERMHHESILSDKFTFLGVLKACGTLGAIERGRHVHKQLISRGFQLDIVVANALVDMYVKCGSLEEAQKVFEELPDPNVISWNSIVSGYSQLGDVILAIQCLEDMQCKPDDVTFVGILSVSRHAGLVNEGHYYFRYMTRCFGITPTIFHCNCMVDLLGRAGLFSEAISFLKPTKPNVSGLMSLLSACKMHRHVELGRQCFNGVVNLDSCCTPGYVLMSDIYASAKLEENDHDKPEGALEGSWNSLD